MYIFEGQNTVLPQIAPRGVRESVCDEEEKHTNLGELCHFPIHEMSHVCLEQDIASHTLRRAG